jgi:hypothetical protein
MPVFAPLPHGDQSGYPPHDYYDFDFTISKTANWTKNSHRRLAYRVLTTITDGRVDRLRMPVTLEWPQVVPGILLAMAVAAIHAFAPLVRWAVAS